MKHSFYVHPSRDGIHAYILPRELQQYLGAGQIYEQDLIDWTLQFVHSDKIALDIGAHTGTWTVNLAKKAKHVMAFEPQKSVYFALCGTVALHGHENVDCFNIALGSREQEGEATLYKCSTDGGGTSLFKGFHKGQAILGTERTQIKCLDDYSFADPISFIKIDAEGNEENIIRGGINTIARFRPHIVFEDNNGFNEAISNLLKTIHYSMVQIANSGNMFLASPLG